MIDRQRKRALAALAAAAAACAISLTAVCVEGRISDLAARTVQYERRLSQVSQDRSGSDGLTSRVAAEQLGSLETRLYRERAHFYGTGELSLTEFSSQIEHTLTSTGLTIRRFRPIDPDGGQGGTTLVEFVVRGRATSLLAFLAQISRSPKYRPIARIAIHRLAHAGFVDATFRIGYEEVEVVGPQ